MSELHDLFGKTLTSVENVNGEELVFTTTEGRKYRLYHYQDCCESVFIESIVGDLNDLVGEPLLMVEESSNEGESEYGTSTWTFYKFATRKGYVDVRWFGESNGYYSESVDFEEVGDETCKENQ